MTAPTRTKRKATTAGYDEINSRLTRVLLYLIAFAVLALIIIPVAFAVLGGFRSMGQLSENPVSLPNPWVFTNYADVLTLGTFWRQLANSAVIALLTTIVVLPAASLAAFVLSRYSFRGREAIYTLFTFGLLFPVTVAIVPLFVVIRQINLLDNPLGVALPQAAFALPLSIVIMRPFFRSIPADLEEAASIDGCGPFRFYWSIMLPLSRPVLSTIAVIAIVTQLERLPASAGGAQQCDQLDPADRRDQLLQPVHDRHGPRAGVHHALDGAGAALLPRGRTPDSEWAVLRSGQGMNTRPTAGVAPRGTIRPHRMEDR